MSYSLSHDQKKALLFLLKEAVEKDDALRANYQIGSKFQFIHDKFVELSTQFTAYLNETNEDLSALIRSTTLKDNEIVVYVYLFNAKGVLKETWQKMISQPLLDEYSVNRPIYTEKKFIEAFLKNKTDPAQHAYLTIAIEQSLLISESEESVKDGLGNPLVKVKEGAFRFDRVLSLHHQQQDYAMSVTGELLLND